MIFIQSFLALQLYTKTNDVRLLKYNKKKCTNIYTNVFIKPSIMGKYYTKLNFMDFGKIKMIDRILKKILF